MAETVPPKSSINPRHWGPTGIALVLTAFGGFMTAFGAFLGPLLTKPDLSGYVKEERLTSCEAKLDARSEASEKALDAERERTTACYDKLGACQSQQGASEVVIDSLNAKKRR